MAPSAAKDLRSIRAAVIDVLAAVCGRPAAELDDSASLADMNMDSLTLAAIVSVIEQRCATSFDSDATLEIVRAPDVGSLVAAVSRAAAPHGAQSE
jgi:acyl carrier protein